MISPVGMTWMDIELIIHFVPKYHAKPVNHTHAQINSADRIIAH